MVRRKLPRQQGIIIRRKGKIKLSRRRRIVKKKDKQIAKTNTDDEGIKKGKKTAHGKVDVQKEEKESDVNTKDIDQKKEDTEVKDINQKKGMKVCHDRFDDRLKNDGQNKDVGKGWNFG